MKVRTVVMSAVVGFGVAGPGCASCDNGSSVTADSGMDVTNPPDTGGPSDAAGESDGDADAGPAAPSAGNTGAFAVVTVGNKQKMYLPVRTLGDAGNAVIAVVDVGIAGNGAAGAPALIKTIDLGTTNVATTAGGDSTAIVAASTGTPDIWFIDPTTDTLVKHTALDATYGESNFSGLVSGGYVTGIAVDSASHRAILGVWNGFALVDLVAKSITSVVQAPPSENFGFDSVHQVIYAPFYLCSTSSLHGQPPPVCNTPLTPLDAGPDAGRGQVMQEGLSVITLADNLVYTYEDPAAANPDLPLGSRPDSAGVDPTTQIAIVPSEVGGYQNVLDFSKATFDMTSKTVSAPHQILANFPPQGVAIEPGSHLAFFEAEGGTDVGVLRVSLANMGDQASVGGTLPALPGAAGAFQGMGDPHGLGVIVLTSNGKAVGIVPDVNLRWIGRVDLEALANLEQSDASVTADAAQMQAAVTYLDATTIE
jgi:hypothetical protein